MLFTWLRWLISGKSLEERLDKLVKIQDEFEYHAEITCARKARKEAIMETLRKQTAAHAIEIDRAKLVAENFKALRTQRLVSLDDAKHGGRT